jgi:site-specific DNA-methyltransferase (adenine-specific)/site-specific DNA-methyltransferase (cytosine-N4-specific)
LEKEILGSLELNRIYQLDCYSGIDLIPDNSLDLIITSPPYAMQRKDSYGGINEADYPDWICSIMLKCFNKLKPSGSFILNIKEHVNKGKRSLYVYESVIKLAKKINYIEEYIWNKTNPFPTGNKKRLKDGFERCYHFSKTLNYKFYPENVLEKSKSKWLESEKKRTNKGEHNTTNGSKMNMSKRVANDMVRPSNVITCSSSNLNIGHPAVFPVQIPEFFIRLMTDKNDVVLDPFMGSGTTAVAALKNNRKFIGFEVEPKYIEIANKRIESTYNEIDDQKILKSQES